MEKGPRAWRVVAGVAAATVLLGLVPMATASAAAPALDVGARLLTVSDLPAGWHSARPTSTRLDLAGTPCLRGISATRRARRAAKSATFGEGSGLPALSESLANGTSAAKFHAAVVALGRCHSVTLTINAKHVEATIGKTPLPIPGAASHAFLLAVVVTDVPIGADIVLFREQGVDGELVYVAVGTPTPVTVETLARLAVSKVQGHGVSAPTTVAVTAVPVRVAHTTLGTVGYREVGTGPPLVLIMGFGGTMETWDPRFVDALAHDHEVVIFDNAGIGDTRALPSPLTIDAMANQTSALISELGLDQPDVLGWSMGTMIAEALAVLHPTQVRRLVLCAAYPGTGTVEPSQKAIDEITGGVAAEALAALFPSNERVAETGYVLSLADWPKGPSAPADVVKAQEQAIKEWWSGADAAGKRTNAIAVPTLIADGTLDRLDPLANARRLQKLIPGAELALYTDAGHAFLFQDESLVVRRIETFLGQ